MYPKGILLVSFSDPLAWFLPSLSPPSLPPSLFYSPTHTPSKHFALYLLEFLGMLVVYVHLNFELISWKCLKSFKKNGENGDLATVLGQTFWKER